MSRPLDQLSPDELGRRFPVILLEYDPAWPARYSDEKACIERTLGSYIIRGISHIGSTSVPGLVAKPTIDILLEVREDADRDWLVRCFAAMEYGYIPQPNKPPPHLFFMKGYTQEGFRGQVFHVHVRYRVDWDERYFRDYLIRHPDTAWEYGELKRQLKKTVRIRPGCLYRKERGACPFRCERSTKRAGSPKKARYMEVTVTGKGDYSEGTCLGTGCREHSPLF